MLQALTMAETDLSYADKFVHSLATRDFVALGEAFAPEVQFRAPGAGGAARGSLPL